MKALLIFGLLFGASAMAAPTVLNVTGSVYAAASPNGECGASQYGYIVQAMVVGNPTLQIHGCVESMVIPLEASDCLQPANRDDVMRTAREVLKNASLATRAIKMRILVDDPNTPNDNGFTILSIRMTCN